MLLVNAPAGAGKTTLLAQLAATSDVCSWYELDDSDVDAEHLLAHLARAVDVSMPGLPSDWRSADDAARAFEAWEGGPCLFILDDFEVLHGSPGEGVMEHLIRYSPPIVTFAIASRSSPGFNLPRLRVSGEISELTMDDLRFRSWEVERLFSGVYGDAMPPEDVLLVTRRLHGWAAGLRLFHLATRGKSSVHRRRILDSLATRPALVQEYLVRNVVDELPPALREFLMEVCVLEPISESLCDRLLGRGGNGPMLHELERRQLVTNVDQVGEYRCDAILRSYLEFVLVDLVGERAARERYRAAGALLEEAGAAGQAVRAFCRAEDWGAVRRILGNDGPAIADDASAIDEVPFRIVGRDPWLRLGLARRHVASGRMLDAIREYEEAELAFGAVPAGRIARTERLALRAWLTPGGVPAFHPFATVRAATIGGPMAVRRPAVASASSAERALANGLAALLAGEVTLALADLGSTGPGRSWPVGETGPILSLALRLSDAVARLLSGDPGGMSSAELVADDAERIDVPWLARIARAVLALGESPEGVSDATAAAEAFNRNGDAWGTGLARFAEGWGRLRAGSPVVAPLSIAAERFASVGAFVPETWARAAMSLAMVRDHAEGAREAAVDALERCRRDKLRGVAAVAHLALAEIDGSERRSALADRIARDCGLALPVQPARPARRTERVGSEGGRDAPSTISVRCFGGFEISVGGRTVDLAELRPRQRQALRLLALHAGRPIHREVMASALWPELPPETAIRNVHVAISALRGALDRAGLGKNLILREEGAYRIAPPLNGGIDLAMFELALREARAAQAAGDLPSSIDRFARALDLYDEVLPEDGPTEWVIAHRDGFAAEAAEATRRLVELLLATGRPKAAAAYAERWLRVDPYHDDLWRLRIAACERAGDLAASARARARYRGVLMELGVDDVQVIDAGPDPIEPGHATRVRVRAG